MARVGRKFASAAPERTSYRPGVSASGTFLATERGHRSYAEAEAKVTLGP